jgi:protocatechuate 3,4-dioxygenase beta subunit
LQRGVWIEGRITDKRTGKGLPGELQYVVQKANPNRELGSSFVDERDRLQADDDGRFRIAAAPGLGYVGFRAFDHETYPRTDNIVTADGKRRKVDQSMIETASVTLIPSNYHVVAEVNPAAGAERYELNLQLDGGDVFKGRVVDTDGKPVQGFYYAGRLAQPFLWRPAKNDVFELVGYQPDSPRRLFFAHRERKLAGSATFSGELPKDLVVKLQPAGTVRGRLVDDDGTPLVNYELTQWYPPMRSPAEMARMSEATPLPPHSPAWQVGRYETGDDGRFEISCLAPGVEYRIQAFDRERMTRRGGQPRKPAGPLEKVIVVEPGQTLDLGDVRLADEAKSNTKPTGKQAKPAPAGNASVTPIPNKSSSDQHRVAIRGRVTGPDGKPAAGANVSAIGDSNRVGRGGDLNYDDEVLAETSTDGQGNYELIVAGVSSKSHRSAALVASATGASVAWRQLDLDAEKIDAPVELKAEQVIRGHLTDIEGKPASGIRMTITAVTPTTSGERSRDGVWYHNRVQRPAAWPTAVVSDEAGRFELHNIGSGYGVFIDIEGNDRFAPQSLAINRGMAEQRGERDGTYRPQFVKNLKPSEEAVIPLAPAQIFEGVVTYADTGKPAPHARLTVWASQQKFGSMSSIAGKGDADGRYRISPQPGIRFGVTAFPPDGTAYLAREAPAVDWEDAATRKQVDVQLPRGVLVRGQIVESKSGSPVAGASIQYVAEEQNKPSATDDIVTGWQAIQISDQDGKFEIAVLSGPGRLLVHGPVKEFVVKESTTRELSSGRIGGRRCYANAFYHVNPSPDASAIDVVIQLERAQKVGGKIVDEQGRPVNEAIVISRLITHPYFIQWRGDLNVQARNGQFELPGLAPDQETTVYFLDASRKLGATAKLKADGGSPTITLRPCGQAIARFADGEGEPLADFTSSLHMVVTPGGHRDDPVSSLAMKVGMLAEEADFVANIDRKNYWPGPRSDDNGQITFPALIPGATYRISGYENGKSVPKEFRVKAEQTIDLGKFVIDQRR